MKSKRSFKALGIDANFLAIGNEISSFDTSQIVVLPAPYEHTVSYGGGTRRGPDGIIKASQYVEFYDEELDRELCEDVGIATLPSVKFGKAVHAKALNILYNVVRDLLTLNKFVVTIGGEHTISQAPIKAHLEKYPMLSVIQFDAHSDLRDSYQGSKYSHASVMARVCELMDPKRIVQVGIRAQCVEEAHFIKKMGVNTFYAHQIRGQDSASWQDGVLECLTDKVYVTFDVDGFDPSIMPSTGTPEPNGLFWAETMQLLRRIGEERTIVGCDIVELSPVKAVAHADLTAAKLTYKLMNYAFIERAR
ncbi:MAG: Agmatinase [Bacteroidetes bacterium]|nr:Agmatinase [Bacteroidota bacterium]